MTHPHCLGGVTFSFSVISRASLISEASSSKAECDMVTIARSGGGSRSWTAVSSAVGNDVAVPPASLVRWLFVTVPLSLARQYPSSSEGRAAAAAAAERPPHCLFFGQGRRQGHRCCGSRRSHAVRGPREFRGKAGSNRRTFGRTYQCSS
jgi:hypothetical protein